MQKLGLRVTPVPAVLTAGLRSVRSAHALHTHSLNARTVPAADTQPPRTGTIVEQPPATSNGPGMEMAPPERAALAAAVPARPLTPAEQLLRRLHQNTAMLEVREQRLAQKEAAMIAREAAEGADI